MKKLGLGCGSVWLVSISQKVGSWSCRERHGDAMGCPCGSWGHSQQSPGASGESRWLPLELTPTCSPPPPNGASTTALRSQHLLAVAVHLRPPLWRHCRPPDRPSPKKCSPISDRGRDRVEQPEPDRVFSSRPASGSHDEERTRLPTPGFEFALAPKKPSEPNPPPTRTQDPIKSAQKRASKVPSIREEDEPEKPERPERPEKPEKPENAYDICREHLTKTRLSAGQGSRWESSGTIWGSTSIRHRLSLIRASAFVLLRGRHVNQTLMGGKGGCARQPTPSGRTVCTVSPLKPSRSGPWLAQLCKGAATMPSTSFFRQDMPVSSPNHEPLDREGYEHSLPAQQGSLTLLLVPRIPYREWKETGERRSVCCAGQGHLPLSRLDIGAGEACERIKLGCRGCLRSLGEFQPFLWRSPLLEDGEPSITELTSWPGESSSSLAGMDAYVPSFLMLASSLTDLGVGPASRL